MAGSPPDEAAAGTERSMPFDTNMAHIARVYDYWLGGKDNFAADREAAELALDAYPTWSPRSAPTGRSWPGSCGI